MARYFVTGTAPHAKAGTNWHVHREGQSPQLATCHDFTVAERSARLRNEEEAGGPGLPRCGAGGPGSRTGPG